MSDNQLACLLFAAPFLTLSLAWAVGLTFLALTEK
jgi:hypothetical protein